MAVVFSRFLGIDLPASLECDDSGKNPAFEVSFSTDGVIPFPAMIIISAGRGNLDYASQAPLHPGYTAVCSMRPARGRCTPSFTTFPA